MTLRLSNLYSVIHPYVQDDARRVSREHRDVVTSTVIAERFALPGDA